MFKKYLLICLLFISTAVAFAQDFPAKPSTLVNDYTNTLTADEKAQLERKVVAFDDSTSTQISIVILRSLGGYDIDDYGVQLGRRWGIGQKDKNNGILILVALEDRKLAIKTGYGVEGALPDATAYRIREDEINPYFRKGQFYQGLNAGIDAIIKYTKGEYKADKKPRNKERSGKIGFFILMIIVIMVIIARRGGRGGGGGGRIIGRRGSASPLWWFLADDMMGRSNSSGNDWGGFSGGGGSSGGGFGGFGGGSFGGGGSSGSW